MKVRIGSNVHLASYDVARVVEARTRTNNNNICWRMRFAPITPIITAPHFNKLPKILIHNYQWFAQQYIGSKHLSPNINLWVGSVFSMFILIVQTSFLIFGLYCSSTKIQYLYNVFSCRLSCPIVCCVVCTKHHHHYHQKHLHLSWLKYIQILWTTKTFAFILDAKLSTQVEFIQICVNFTRILS